MERNANGRIIGFTWSRRALELDNGSWIGSFVAGRNGSNGERGPILLSQEGVKKLPMIEFGVDNVQEIVARYRSNDDDDKKNDNDRDDDKDKKRLNEGNNDIDKYDDDGDDDDDDHVESQDIKTEKDLIVAAYDSCITCSICICDFEHGEKLRLLPECGHVFHTECIMPWLTGKKNACPLCQRRVKVSEEDIRQGDDEDVVQQWRIATSLMSGQIQQDRPPVNVSGSFEQSDSLRRDSREDLNSSVSTLDLSSGGPYPQDNNSSSALSSSRRDLTIFP
jgi:RING-finger-containing ubiquitin ligase